MSQDLLAGPVNSGRTNRGIARSHHRDDAKAAILVQKIVAVLPEAGAHSLDADPRLCQVVAEVVIHVFLPFLDVEAPIDHGVAIVPGNPVAELLDEGGGGRVVREPERGAAHARDRAPTET